MHGTNTGAPFLCPGAAWVNMVASLVWNTIVVLPVCPCCICAPVATRGTALGSSSCLWARAQYGKGASGFHLSHWTTPPVPPIRSSSAAILTGSAVQKGRRRRQPTDRHQAAEEIDLVCTAPSTYRRSDSYHFRPAAACWVPLEAPAVCPRVRGGGEWHDLAGRDRGSIGSRSSWRSISRVGGEGGALPGEGWRGLGRRRVPNKA